MKQISFRFIRWTGHGSFLLVLKGGAFSEVDTGVLRGLPDCLFGCQQNPSEGNTSFSSVHATGKTWRHQRPAQLRVKLGSRPRAALAARV